jgi:hypothetical protein
MRVTALRETSAGGYGYATATEYRIPQLINLRRTYCANSTSRIYQALPIKPSSYPANLNSPSPVPIGRFCGLGAVEVGLGGRRRLLPNQERFITEKNERRETELHGL